MSGRGQKNTAVAATIARTDKARLDRFLAGQSMNDWLRSLMSDALEEAGEPPLAELDYGTQRKNTARGTIPHGTLSGYVYHKCRCGPCREAETTYRSACDRRRVS